MYIYTYSWLADRPHRRVQRAVLCPNCSCIYTLTPGSQTVPTDGYNGRYYVLTVAVYTHLLLARRPSPVLCPNCSCIYTLTPGSQTVPTDGYNGRYYVLTVAIYTHTYSWLADRPHRRVRAVLCPNCSCIYYSWLADRPHRRVQRAVLCPNCSYIYTHLLLARRPSPQTGTMGGRMQSLQSEMSQ